MGKEVPWEDGVGVCWLCWCERQGRGLRAGEVGRTVCGVCFSRAGMKRNGYAERKLVELRGRFMRSVRRGEVMWRRTKLL